MVLERLKLDGKVAIVTGGGRGIGRGIARVFSEAGAKLVVTARTASELDASVAGIKEMGGEAIGVQSDATKIEDVKRTLEAALDSYGRLDIMVNNVGGATYSNSFDDITAEKLVSDFNLNVVTAFNFTQLAAPHLRKSGSGSVINISSRAASGFSNEGLLPYSVTKLALEQLTRMTARSLAPEVRVNAIRLGTIEATWIDSSRMDEAAKARIAAQIPLQRIGEAEDIGLAALYLCSEGCYASGSIITVDGALHQKLNF